MYRYRTVIIIFLITILGTLLRLHSLSPFKIYPDSYQNLLVAYNIAEYRSVVGYLGEHGMIYPPFFMWSRPVYPLLINIVDSILKNTTQSAQLISLITSIASIPLSFLFIRSVYNNLAMQQFSNFLSYAAALLLTLSFNHTSWTGFIMTESTGIFVLLLFLWQLFSILNNEKKQSTVQNICTGLLFGIAIFTRYEYAIVLVPVSMLIFWKNPRPFMILGTITTGTLIATAIFLLLFPLPSTLLLIPQQLHLLLWRAGIILSVFAIATAVFILLSKPNRTKVFLLMHKLVVCIVLLTPVLVISTIFFPTISFLNTYLTGIQSFLKNDLLLSSTAFIGTILLLFDKNNRHLAYFTLTSSLFLWLFYIRVNPAMERYLTHLIPFLLIPASYGISKVVQLSVFGFRFSEFSLPVFSLSVYRTDDQKTDKLLSENRHLRTDNRLTKIVSILAVTSLIAASVYQLSITYNGFRPWGDKSWYSSSYEEVSAQRVNTYLQTIPKKPELLVVSFPEPYFYFTNIPTQSIADAYPFIYIDDAANKKTILMIQDMGMHDLFPQFSEFLTKNMSEFQVFSFKTNAYYHYGFRSEKEKHPVILYQTTLEMVKKKIQNSHKQT